MTPAIRNAVIGVIASVIALLTALLFYFKGEIEPIPEPSPGISAPPPSAEPTGDVLVSWNWDQKPMPGFQPEMHPASDLKGSRGEIIGVVMENKGTGCVSEKETPEAKVSLFEMGTYQVDRPSFNGAATGTYYDPLIPRSQVCGKGYFWADVEIKRDAAPGAYTLMIGSARITLTVWKMVMPTIPTMPMYIGVMPMPLLKHHGYPNTAGVNDHGPLIVRYTKLLRDHRIENFAHYLGLNKTPKADGTLDMDQFGAYSFRNLVLKDRLAGPMFPSRSTATESYLTALEKTIRAENIKDAWTYAWDEPNAAEIPDVAELVSTVKRFAPSLKTMVTTQPKLQLKLNTDWFTPVINQFLTPGNPQLDEYGPQFGLYGSCMEAGTCSNGTVGNPRGTPMVATIDAPPAHARAYAPIIYRMGAYFGLYYIANESFKALDPWVDQYLFGQHGDGTLVYPGKKGDRGLTNHTACPSVRLKLIRTGMYDVEYYEWAKAKGILGDRLKTLIPDQKTWNKSYGAHQALRNKLGEELNAQ